MATKITHLQSPADSKKYKTVKSKGEPKIKNDGYSPAQHQKTYGYVRASGEPKVSAGGAAPSEQKKYSAKPNLKSR